MDIFLQVFFTVLIFLGGLILIYSIFIVRVLLRPNRPTLEEAYQIEIECKGIDENWIKVNKSKDFIIPIDNKNYLSGSIFYCEKPSNKYIIGIHGWGYNRVGMFKYVDMLRDIGFNVVLYDHRGLGKSSGKIVTLGYREKDDLHLLINYLKSNHQVDVLGLHGISMGASTALLYQQNYHGADFIIADCGYASLKRLIKEVLKRGYHLPTFNLLLVEFIIYLVAKFTYNRVSPLENIDQLKCPILYIHGLKDNLISYQHSIDMFLKTKGIKEIILIDGGIHAGAILSDKDKYKKTVQEFILKNI
jgi:alpha-beta hydrolase superfamily lysophospholipase